MPSSLTATPNVSSAPTLTPIALIHALFPPFYPGTSAFPGRGNDLGAVANTNTVLTVSAA